MHLHDHVLDRHYRPRSAPWGGTTGMNDETWMPVHVPSEVCDRFDSWLVEVDRMRARLAELEQQVVLI